jgi:hypothetical protein
MRNPLQFNMPAMLVKTGTWRISFNIQHLNPFKRRWAVAVKRINKKNRLFLP